MWNDASGQFLCYYINFQLPFTRSQCGFDTFDLELDMVIEPTFAWKWKDVREYQQGIQRGILREEWVEAIENAKPEILATIEQQGYPLNSSWLDWQPDPAWQAPNLPLGWDQ
jgi:protein associated with RNAse G/E